MERVAEIVQPGGLQQIFHFHGDRGGTVTLEERQDCTAIVDAVKELGDANTTRKATWWRHQAVIPDVVLNRAFREGWFHDAAAWRRWMNDPDNRAFRVEHAGRVDRV